MSKLGSVEVVLFAIFAVREALWICLPINKIKVINEIGKLNGKPLTISGFERTTQSGEPTKILQFANILKQNSDECQKYSNNDKIDIFFEIVMYFTT